LGRATDVEATGAFFFVWACVFNVVKASKASDRYFNFIVQISKNSNISNVIEIAHEINVKICVVSGELGVVNILIKISYSEKVNKLC
jgi:hypothetical protein